MKVYICSVVAILLLFSGIRAEGQIVSVSVPKLHLAKNERIVGLEIHVHSGRIALLPNIPIGWSMSVENDPSWNTLLKGSIYVGGAATDEKFLQDFMVIEVEPEAPSDTTFDLQGEVIVTSDFKVERRIKLSRKDFVTKGAGKAKTTTSR